MNLVNDKIFLHPFTCLIAGPTQSGKTTLLKKILEYNQILIDPPPARVIYCYSRWQENFELLKLSVSNIEFKSGLIDIDEISKQQNNLIILDDLMTDCEKDESILNLFTIDSHHKNISVILISQNLFSHGKYSRTISLNCQYLIILNNPRDKSQIFYLARQMYPTNPNFLIECYNDATENKEYGYLFIDLKQSTQKDFRIQSGITMDEQRIIYKQKE